MSEPRAGGGVPNRGRVKLSMPFITKLKKLARRSRYTAPEPDSVTSNNFPRRSMRRGSRAVLPNLRQTVQDSNPNYDAGSDSDTDTSSSEKGYDKESKPNADEIVETRGEMVKKSGEVAEKPKGEEEMKVIRTPKLSKPVTASNSRQSEIRTGLQKIKLLKGAEARINIYINSRLGWIHSTQANFFFAILIVLSAVSMGMEVEFRTAENWTNWVILEASFLFVFSVEIIWRTLAQSRIIDVFNSGWHWFDIIIVLVGLIDLFAEGISDSDRKPLPAVASLRILRVLRIVRVIKMFRYLKDLTLLLQGVFRSLKIMVWLALFMAMIIYIFALTVTRIVKSSEVISEKLDEFRHIDTSMFALFRIVTLDNWGVLASAVNEQHPGMMWFFILFVVLCNILLLNILSGVIIENVLDVARSDEEERLKKEERVLRLSVDKWIAVFCRADSNQDDLLTREEYVEFIQGKKDQDGMDIQEALQSAKVSVDDAHTLFDIFDSYDANGVGVEDFVEGLLRSHGPAQSRHLLEAQLSIRAMGDILAKLHERQTDMAKSLNGLQHEAKKSRTETTKKLESLERMLRTILPVET